MSELVTSRETARVNPPVSKELTAAMSLWDTYRLGFSPFSLFTYIVVVIAGALFLFVNLIHPFGTPLGWLNIFLSVVIILLMVIDPIVEALNAPKVRLWHNHQDDIQTNERRFGFGVGNFGHKPAINARMELKALIVQGLNPNMVGVVVFEGQMIPFVKDVSESRWFTPGLGYDVYYKGATNDIRFEWTRPETSEKAEKKDEIKYRHVVKGPFKLDLLRFEVAITWEYAGKTDFLGKHFVIDWRPNGIGKQQFPTVTEEKMD